MKTAYIQCFSGITGKLLLGALLDTGLELKDLKSELTKLGLAEFDITAKKIAQNGLHGTEVYIKTSSNNPKRKIKEILSTIENSQLNLNIKKNARAIFLRLAEAEAVVHHTSLENLNFNELGSDETIIEICGSLICLEMLGIENVISSALHIGSGLVKCEHGLIPIPAPVTLELIKNVPVFSQGINNELVTPTGAAIITHIAQKFQDCPVMKVKQSAYGASGFKLPIPNLLRIVIGESGTEHKHDQSLDHNTGIRKADGILIEANIDDMNPEYYDYIMKKLFENGALDVFLQPVQMKKNRPATVLSIVGHEKDLENFNRIIFSETSSIGVRVYPIKKYMLSYEKNIVKTEIGDIAVKIAKYKNNITNIAPEYEDCQKAAKEYNIPLKEVYEIVKRAFNNYQ